MTKKANRCHRNPSPKPAVKIIIMKARLGKIAGRTAEAHTSKARNVPQPSRLRVQAVSSPPVPSHRRSAPRQKPFFFVESIQMAKPPSSSSKSTKSITRTIPMTSTRTTTTTLRHCLHDFNKTKTIPPAVPPLATPIEASSTL